MFSRRKLLAFLPAAPLAASMPVIATRVHTPSRMVGVMLPRFEAGGLIKTAEFNQAFATIEKALNELLARQVPPQDI
jgi:hypothetical protein